MNSDSAPPRGDNGAGRRSVPDRSVDLTLARPVEFAHLFPDQTSAEAFGSRTAALGFTVEVQALVANGSSEWDVTCTFELVPTHRDVSRTEMSLAKLAREHGGRERGWGFSDS